MTPLRTARIAGVFYLLNIVAGSLALVAGNLVVNLVASASYIVVTVLFYGIFRPVSRSLSLIAALFSLLGCVAGILSRLRLATLPVNNLVFFGIYCLLIGYLIFRSTFLPRMLGVLMAVGGVGWLTFLWPPLARQLSPYNLAPGILGEGALTVWLLVKGVNVSKWEEEAARGA